MIRLINQFIQFTSLLRSLRSSKALVSARGRKNAIKMVKLPLFYCFACIILLQNCLSFQIVSIDKEKAEDSSKKGIAISNNVIREAKPDDNSTVVQGIKASPETHLSTLRPDFNNSRNANNTNAANKTDSISHRKKVNRHKGDKAKDALSSTSLPLNGTENKNGTAATPLDKGKNETECSKAVNLLFLLDSSESVKYQHWSLILDFVKSVAHHFTLQATKLGVIRYASEAEIALPMSQFKDETARNNAIDNIFYKTGGTRTDVALEKASELLHGVEKLSASQVLILVTDGPTNALEINKNKFVEGKDLVQGPADTLKSDGVAIFCVGIEPDSVTPEEMQTMKDEMRVIASEPKTSHVFIADGYRELERRVDSVSKAACVVNGAWSQWSEFSPCTVTCGYGTKVRIRTCTNPKPENNGADCTGSRVENKPCDMGPCVAFLTSTTKESAANPAAGLAASSTQITPLEGTSQNYQVIQNVIEEIQKFDDRQSACPNGFEEIHLRDDQYTASSTYSRGIGDEAIIKLHAPQNGKLNYIDNAGSWCAEPTASTNDTEQYLQLNLDRAELVSMVATQGSHEYNSWVTSYYLEYSEDGLNWMPYKKKAKMMGNQDKDTIRKQVLNPAVRAKHFRVIPLEWHSDGNVERHEICLRTALFKCLDVPKDNNKEKIISSVTKRSSTDSNIQPHQISSRTLNSSRPISKRILGRLRKMAKHIIRQMKKPKSGA